MLMLEGQTCSLGRAFTTRVWVALSSQGGMGFVTFIDCMVSTLSLLGGPGVNSC